MSSKRILLVTLCLAALIITVGAYAYVQISSLQNQLDSIKNEKTFNFFWGGPIAEKFNVTTFWMNITFERVNETHLIITVETNNVAYYGGYVGIAFDIDQNGELDRNDEGRMYKARPMNISWNGDPTEHYMFEAAWLGRYNGSQRFFTSFGAGVNVDAHTVTFDPQLGYTYIIPVNLQDVLSPETIHGEIELINDLIHVEYDYAVSVEFSFGMELIE